MSDDDDDDIYLVGISHAWVVNHVGQLTSDPTMVRRFTREDADHWVADNQHRFSHRLQVMHHVSNPG